MTPAIDRFPRDSEELGKNSAMQCLANQRLAAGNLCNTVFNGGTCDLPP